MRYIEAPTYLYKDGFIKPFSSNCTVFDENSIFLGGSITGAWNWQKYLASKLEYNWTIFNPRRENYDGLIPNAEREQITWEFKALQFCRNIVFYFSHETLAPITLFEYGKMLKSNKNLFVCIHPEYKRKNDVWIQTELELNEYAQEKNRKVVFCETLDGVVQSIEQHVPYLENGEWKKVNHNS